LKASTAEKKPEIFSLLRGFPLIFFAFAFWIAFCDLVSRPNGTVYPGAISFPFLSRFAWLHSRSFLSERGERAPVYSKRSKEGMYFAKLAR
jgi:hypothetical protein